MNSKEASTVSSSCFWVTSDQSKDAGYSYPDRFHVTTELNCGHSSKEYLLDAPEDEKSTSEYRLRCHLFQYCVELIDSTVNDTVCHTTNHSTSLIKEYLRSVSMYLLNASY